MHLFARTATLLLLTIALSACYNTQKKYSNNEAMRGVFPYWSAEDRNMGVQDHTLQDHMRGVFPYWSAEDRNMGVQDHKKRSKISPVDYR
jgi:hypothetical protein